jgi:hypothetical protein
MSMLPDRELQRAADNFASRLRPPRGSRPAEIRFLIIPMGEQTSIPTTLIPPDYLVRIPVAWDTLIIGWILFADVAGSLDLSIRQATYDGYPSTIDMVGAGPGPSLGGAIKSISPGANLGGIMSWSSTLLRDGDCMLISPIGTPTVHAATLGLRVQRYLA